MRLIGPVPELDVICKPLHARLTKRGCKIRQVWSLAKGKEPYARACWRCPLAMPKVREAGRLAAERSREARICPVCGEREREVDEDLRVLPTCRPCAFATWRAKVGWFDETYTS